MLGLKEALADLEGMLNSPDGVDKSGDDLAKFVIQRRAKTIGKIAEVVKLGASDPHLAAAPALKREFDEKLQSIRRAAAGIQAKYRASDIATDLTAYGPQSRATAQSLVDFCRWARARL